MPIFGNSHQTVVQNALLPAVIIRIRKWRSPYFMDYATIYILYCIMNTKIIMRAGFYV